MVAECSKKVAVNLSILATFLFLLTGCALNNSHNNYYNDNGRIASDENSCNCSNWSGNFQDDGKSYVVQIGNLDGVRRLATAEVESDCETEIHFSIKANSGKAKLVLVNSNSNVQVLKEVNAQNEQSYNGNIKVHCRKGRNVMKLVGENFGGEFKISQQNMLFKYSDGWEEFNEAMSQMHDELNNMFNEDFPFGSRKRSRRVLDDFRFGSTVNV